ncbi:MAG: hypothetical protein RBT20_01065 [Syntrophales bacterium]|nr:hypothetical protein [Syntrophales bacterium]
MFCPDDAIVGTPYRPRIRKLGGFNGRRPSRAAEPLDRRDDAVRGFDGLSQDNHGAELPAGRATPDAAGDALRCRPEKPAQPDGGAGSSRGSMAVLWTLAAMLLTLWILGPATGSMLDLLVHLLLALAIFTLLLIMKDLAEEAEAAWPHAEGRPCDEERVREAQISLKAIAQTGPAGNPALRHER